MRKLKLLITIGVFTLASQVASANIKPVSCETNFGEKSFIIESNTVAFKSNANTGRAISSILHAQTKKSHKGFKKTLYVSGNKYFINIKDQQRFSNENDFLAITSPKGHKMTYPLNCHSLN